MLRPEIGSQKEGDVMRWFLQWAYRELHKCNRGYDCRWLPAPVINNLAGAVIAGALWARFFACILL